MIIPVLQPDPQQPGTATLFVLLKATLVVVQHAIDPFVVSTPTAAAVRGMTWVLASPAAAASPATAASSAAAAAPAAAAGEYIGTLRSGGRVQEPVHCQGHPAYDPYQICPATGVDPVHLARCLQAPLMPLGFGDEGEEGEDPAAIALRAAGKVVGKVSAGGRGDCWWGEGSTKGD
jgi:hypothetical protein